MRIADRLAARRKDEERKAAKKAKRMGISQPKLKPKQNTKK